MATRAGIVVTGTEVLSGRVSDRNGPWLSERLQELGADLSHHVIVGDRREELLAALRFLAGEGIEVIVTSGGLGPTADDLTAEVVGAFCGREMVLDEPLEARIAEILKPLLARWPQLDEEAVRASNRKQAVIPAGATILEPVGTAPGLVVPPGGGQGDGDSDGPTVVVLPGPPRELQPMWHDALTKPALRAALAGATEYRQRTLRLFGIPESEIAASLRAVEADGVAIDQLEITTCLRRGEIEMVTRFEPGQEDLYRALEDALVQRHAETLFSRDGTTVDDQVAALLAGPPLRSVAAAESCTGGLLAARLTERAGASAHVAGGIVGYSDEAKRSLAHVPGELIVAHGAVSVEVARALAQGAIAAFGADVGMGVTGVAGPGGGSPEKPVGHVCLSVATRAGASLTRAVNLPGGRSDVRDRSTTVALHLLRRLLLGDSDPAPEAAKLAPQ